MAMLGGECSPCCEGGECFARTCRCLSVEGLSRRITVTYESNLPSVCGQTFDPLSAGVSPSDFELRDRGVSGGCVLDAGEVVNFSNDPDCNFNDSYRFSLSLQQTGQSGSRGDLVVVARLIVGSDSFFRTWTRFDPILQEEITLSSISHRIAGQVTIEDYCKKTDPTLLSIPLRNLDPDDPAQYSGTALLIVPPPVEDNPCTVCNRGQFGDLVSVPRYHRIGDCGSDCPDTSGACCETDGTCNIKPQCECDTDNGAVFAGVGETCEACCGCLENFDAAGSAATLEIKELAFAKSRFPTANFLEEEWNEIHEFCSDDELIEQAETGPFTFPFNSWRYYCATNVEPQGCPGPLWTEYETWEPVGGPTYSPRRENTIDYVCYARRPSGIELISTISFRRQSSSFQLPCQRSVYSYSNQQAVSYFTPDYNYFDISGSLRLPGDSFCRFLAGETLTLPIRGDLWLQGYRTFLQVFGNPTQPYSTSREVTGVVHISMNPLP